MLGYITYDLTRSYVRSYGRAYRRAGRTVTDSASFLTDQQADFYGTILGMIAFWGGVAGLIFYDFSVGGFLAWAFLAPFITIAVVGSIAGLILALFIMAGALYLVAFTIMLIVKPFIWAGKLIRN